MTKAKKALVDESGRIENVIVEAGDFEPPDGCRLVAVDGSIVGPGDAHDGEKFLLRPSDEHEWTGTEWVR